MFQLDLNELRKKYYEKSKSIHPDFHASQKEDSLFLTAYNNQAYQILVDPLSRLKYIIETYHGPINENHALLPQEFLIDMMDLHEQINDAVTNADATLLEKFKVELNALDKNSLETTAPFFEAFDCGDRSDATFNELTVYYFKLKYFKRLKQGLEGGSVEL